MHPIYRILSIDLTPARTSPTLIPEFPVGTGYDAITVLSLDGTSVAALAFGASLDQAPLAAGRTFRFLNSCERPFFADEGLYITNAAGGGTLVLMVSQGTSPQVTGA